MSRRRLASRGGAFRRFFRSGGARIVFLGSPRNAPVELRITPVFKAFFAVVALVGLTLGGHYAWLVLRAGPGARELLEERSSLRELNRGYARDTERMAARIEDLEVQMRRLAVLAGAEPVAPRMAGLGGGANGASGYDYVARRLEDLSGRMAALDRQGVALERVMRDKSRLMASTPSIWPVRRLPLFRVWIPRRPVHRGDRAPLRDRHLGRHRHSRPGDRRWRGDRRRQLLHLRQVRGRLPRVWPGDPLRAPVADPSFGAASAFCAELTSARSATLAAAGLLTSTTKSGSTNARRTPSISSSITPGSPPLEPRVTRGGP